LATKEANEQLRTEKRNVDSPVPLTRK